MSDNDNQMDATKTPAYYLSILKLLFVNAVDSA